MTEITIDGRQVVLRDDIPAAELWPLIPTVASVSVGDSVWERYEWPQAKAAFIAVVESWEFDGDPTDPAFWDGITDAAFMMDVVMPLILVIHAHLCAILNGAARAAGEVAKRSTSG